MKAYRATFPLRAMCRVLGLSTSGYYGWLKRPPSDRARRDIKLQGKILLIWGGSGETYGCPRIHAELQAGGERVSRIRIPTIPITGSGGFRSPWRRAEVHRGAGVGLRV